jgi:adenylosuccinate synthase
LSRVGNEFGSTTGRARRCGWFDGVLARRAAFMSGLTSLCVTKLDVLDGLPEVKICVGYRLGNERLDGPPLLESSLPDCQPVYETMPGWREPSAGATAYRELPQAARNYLGRLEDLVGVPVDIVSTGPSRKAIVVRKHPFA